MNEPTENQGDLIPEQILEASLQLIRESGMHQIMPIHGRSMLPLFQEGDRLVVEPGTAGIRRGDIVVFRQGDQLLSHRVLARRHLGAKPFFLTKGDNLLLPDPLVPASQIIGRASAVRRGNKEISLDTNARRYIAWLIAMVMLAWANLFAGARRLRGRFWSSQPGRFAKFLSRLARAFFGLVLRWTRAFFRH